MKEKLSQALAGFSMRWEILSESPLKFGIYYPSEKEFYQTLSKTRGGRAQTEEGERLRIEAYAMRNAILAIYPEAKIGFGIESQL